MLARSLLVSRRNLLRNRFPPNYIVTAKSLSENSADQPTHDDTAGGFEINSAIVQVAAARYAT